MKLMIVTPATPKHCRIVATVDEKWFFYRKRMRKEMSVTEMKCKKETNELEKYT